MQDITEKINEFMNIREISTEPVETDELHLTYWKIDVNEDMDVAPKEYERDYLFNQTHGKELKKWWTIF